MKDIKKRGKYIQQTQQQQRRRRRLEPIQTGGDTEDVILVGPRRLHTCQLQSRPNVAMGYSTFDMKLKRT